MIFALIENFYSPRVLRLLNITKICVLQERGETYSWSKSVPTLRVANLGCKDVVIHMHAILSSLSGIPLPITRLDERNCGIRVTFETSVLKLR